MSRALGAELSEHLGLRAGETPPTSQENRRNGTTGKTLRTEEGPIEIPVPRDRRGSFEPQLLPKRQRDFNGFDDKILSMSARGMTVREIRAHLEEIYAVEVSADLISRVTDSVVDELRSWQSRPLDAGYLVVYFDALMVKTRDKGQVQNKSVYLAMGIGADRRQDVLGMWIQASEGAKFWLSILTELRQRGVADILNVCADGRTGLPEAAEAAPAAFEERWDNRFPMIGAAWRRRSGEITPFLAFAQEVRHVIYTTNAIESLNRQLRKIIETRNQMPTDEATFELLYLAIRNVSKKWKSCSKLFTQELLQLAVHFEGRIPEC